LTSAPDPTLQQLRDVILIEADWLRAQAEWLNLMARHHGVPTAPLLNDSATQCRDRARALHEVLAASEPKETAS
jgi:hypothetical protein